MNSDHEYIFVHDMKVFRLSMRFEDGKYLSEVVQITDPLTVVRMFADRGDKLDQFSVLKDVQ